MVTGGLGNLGSWITEHLVRSGFDVATFTVKDRNVLPGYSFTRIFGDIQNEEDVKAIFQNNKWDAIVHLASVNEGNTENYHRRALQINSLGTRNLLQAQADSGQTGCHFIYFSTFHVYGASSGRIEETVNFPHPKNDYASTHLFAEYYVKQFHATSKMPYSIFRLTNSYGCPKEMDNSKWYLVLNDLVRTAAQKGVIRLSSNGRGRRDFIWMGDVCDAVEKMIRAGASNDTFNLGSGHSSTMLDVAKSVQSAFEAYYGKKAAVITNESDQTNYPQDLVVSIDRLKSRISFEPGDHMFREAIKIFEFLDGAESQKSKGKSQK